MSVEKSKKKLAAAVADVPPHIDERLVEVNSRDVLAVVAAIRAQPSATPDAEKLAALEQGAQGAAGRSAYIQAESARFLLAHFQPAPAPVPEPTA
jgi:hypothetical protein